MNLAPAKPCPRCSAPLRPDVRFCPSCGLAHPVPSDDSPAALELTSESAPPPPATGKSVSWQRNPKSGLRPAGAPIPLPVQRPGDPSAGPAQPSAHHPQPSQTLPPPAEPWPFRQSLVQPANKLAHVLAEAIGQGGKPAAATVERIAQAAFCHPTIYRRAAEDPKLQTEAAWIIGAVMVLTTLGYATFLFSTYGPGLFFILKTIVIRAAVWLAAVFAIQAAAKQLHQIDLPFPTWFRALAYAQVAAGLSAIPGVGVIFALWSLVCMVAAIMDVSGADVPKAAILVIIATVAAAVGAMILTAVLI